MGKSEALTDEEKTEGTDRFFFILFLCSGAYYAAKYYVYRLIADSGVSVRFRDVRLSLFPLGIEVHGIKDFPIRDRNLLSFSGVNVYLPTTSLFMKKKAVIIEIEQPRFVLDESLLQPRRQGKGLGSSFTINRIRIRDGELLFKGRGIQCRLLHFSLHTGALGDDLSFRLDSPHLKVTLAVSGEPVTLEGNLVGEARRHGASWRIGPLAWHTREAAFHGNGRILDNGTFQISVSAQGNPESILRPLLEDMTVRGLTYAEARISRDAKRGVRVSATFTSPSCHLRENRMANLSGQVKWDSQRRTLDLEAAFDSELARSTLRLESREGGTRIALQNLPAAAIADILDIRSDAPLDGIVRRGTVEFVPGFIRGRAELDAAPSQSLSQPFVLQGSFDFQRDKSAKQTTFSGQGLQLAAGQLSIQGKIDSRVHTIAIRVDAALKNLEHATPYAAHYLGINLLPWKLSGGSGVFELTIDKRLGRKRIDSGFRLADFQANRQPIAVLRGEVHSAPPVTTGSFTLSAPDLNSKVDLAIAAGKTTLHFQDVAGEARKIMTILGLGAGLGGKIAGDFTYRTGKALAAPEVEGRFTAPRLAFMGFDLAAVSGALRSNLKDIDLQGLTFMYKGGRARADLLIDFGQRRFDLEGGIAGIDAAQLLGGFSGRVDLDIGGRGEFLRDPLALSYRFRDMRYYADRPFSASGTAKILTDFSDYSVKAVGTVEHAGGPSPFTLEISRQGLRSAGAFTFDLRDLDQIIPWRNNAGSMRLLGQIDSKADGGLHSRGVAVFSGRTLSLPGFSHTLDDFQGTVTFADTRFALQSLSGKMGGGQVEGGGQLNFANGQLHDLNFGFKGKGLHLYPMDRASCVVDPDLTLRYEDKKLLLAGTLNFPSVEWQREIDERIVFSTRSELSTAESRIRERLRLDIAMNSGNIQMRNTLGRIQGRFQLHLTGSASFPILIGTCEGRQGEIYLSDRPFNVLKAKLVFNNNYFIDPLIHVESEAFIQSYRIRFDIRGSASHARPELTSSPPLPTQDILALVSMGEVFERSGSSEVSSRDSSAVMVSSKLTKEIEDRANKLLGIDLLRIDPVFSDQSTVDTWRGTIGKSISKDLVVVYSTNLSTSRQEIYYIQYQLSPAISLIAKKNEEGRYSLDLRLRSRH